MGFFVPVIVRDIRLNPEKLGTRLSTRYSVVHYGRDPGMARITRPFTYNEILKAKPREKDFTLHDGDGLFLLVKTFGKKLWRLRYQRPVSGSRTNLSLGSYPALTLAADRQICEQHLTTLAQEMDPQQRQE